MTTTAFPGRALLRRSVPWLIALAFAAGASAQTPVPRPAPAAPPAPAAAADTAAQPTVGPPIQRIETASALSTDPLGAITSVRELADGRVLVNDGTRRRLLLMDTTLTTVGIVLDSLSDVANTYGTRAGALLPFRGDTLLFVDPASFAIVVIDPAGAPVRVRSVWRVQDLTGVTSSTGLYGFPGVDAHGRIVYRVNAQPAPPRVPPPAGVPWFPPQPDSAFIVAVDLDTRRIDTLSVIRIPKTENRVRRTAENRFVFEPVINPVPATDQWAVLPDGTVAFIRWQDYRVEYLNADGSITESQKLPYEWQRLTDDDKRAVVDSVRVAQEAAMLRSYAFSMIMWSNQNAQPYPDGFTVPDGFTLPPGLPQDWILPPGLTFPPNYAYACPPGAEPAPPGPPAPPAPPAAPGAPPGAPGAPPGAPSCISSSFMLGGGMATAPPTLRTVGVMPPEELPDYRPPLMSGSAGAVRADMEGNLWIRTVPVRPIPGGPVYDIVSRAGELVNRIQLPPGYTLVGFGRDKVVYLSMRDPGGLRLARVRLR